MFKRPKDKTLQLLTTRSDGMKTTDFYVDNISGSD